jgi:pSer/pThr/pTyr-binding forkhead associated (FHA) protein
MRARLFARFGPEKGLEVEFGEEATIGRGEENTVPLSSREVSQRHARVFFDTESAAYWVEDLDSLNGTDLDGEPVRGRERLSGLHVLTFGAAAELFFLALEGESEEPPVAEPEATARASAGSPTRVDVEAPSLPAELRQPEPTEQTRVDSETPILPSGLQAKTSDSGGGVTRVEESLVELPSRLVSGQAPAAPAPPPRFVLDVQGEGGGRFELRQGDNLIGRSVRARITLRNRELSRRHATFRVEGDRVWLRDEGSRNHTFVAGEPIAEEVEVRSGSELHFGRLEARLLLPAVGGEEEPE